MRVKLLVGILVLLVVVNLTAVGTFLYIHFTRAERFGGFHRGSMKRPPFLASEDRAKLRGLLMEFHEETNEYRTMLRDLEDQLFLAIHSEPENTAKSDSLLREITEVRYELSKKALEKLAATDFLSPEQRKMFFNGILMGGRRPGEPPSFLRGDRKRAHQNERARERDQN